MNGNANNMPVNGSHAHNMNWPNNMQNMQMMNAMPGQYIQPAYYHMMMNQPPPRFMNMEMAQNVQHQQQQPPLPDVKPPVIPPPPHTQHRGDVTQPSTSHHHPQPPHHQHHPQHHWNHHGQTQPPLPTSEQPALPPIPPNVAQYYHASQIHANAWQPQQQQLTQPTQTWQPRQRMQFPPPGQQSRPWRQNNYFRNNNRYNPRGGKANKNKEGHENGGNATNSLISPDSIKSEASSTVEVVVEEKRRKSMSKWYPAKPWNKQDAEKALKVEFDAYKKQAKILVIRFPDPELTRDQVKAYHTHIDKVHFQVPSGARYCFVQLTEDCNMEEVMEDLKQIEFANLGKITVEKKFEKLEEDVSAESIDPYTLYVGNLPLTISTATVKDLFPTAARVDIGFAQRMKYTRYAFIRYQTVEESIEAFSTNYNLVLENRTLIVRFRRQKGQVVMPTPAKPASKKAKREARMKVMQQIEMDSMMKTMEKKIKQEKGLKKETEYNKTAEENMANQDGEPDLESEDEQKEVNDNDEDDDDEDDFEDKEVNDDEEEEEKEDDDDDDDDDDDEEMEREDEEEEVEVKQEPEDDDDDDNEEEKEIKREDDDDDDDEDDEEEKEIKREDDDDDDDDDEVNDDEGENEFAADNDIDDDNEVEIKQEKDDDDDDDE